MIKRFYVYIYFDPQTQIPFYVGKGSGSRLFSHLHNKKNIKKFEKIQQLISEGYDKTDFIKIYKRNLTSKQAIKLEISLIMKYGRIDFEPNGSLFNLIIDPRFGGMQGHNHSSETKIKMSISRKKFLTEDKRKELSKSLTGREFSKTHRKNLSKSHIGWDPPEKWRSKKSDFMKKHNPSIKTWILKTPSGEILEVTSLKEFCRKNNLPYSSIQNTIRTKKPILHKGLGAGWQIISSSYINKLTSS